MKLFRNKNTEEMYISFTDNKDNLVDFNGNTIICSTEDYEEVNTKPKKQEFRRLHIVEDVFCLEEIYYKDWHLKDILYVPVDGKEVEFRVEHITDDKIYFVAVEAVGKSTMEDVNSFLDDYLKKMPENLVTMMCQNEHSIDGNIVRKSKLTLLSRKNVSESEWDYECNGADDITFDGLKTEAERCKNFDGETEWYWIDTPRSSSNATSSTNFWNVASYGNVKDHNVNTTGAVVPCFSITL